MILLVWVLGSKVSGIHVGETDDERRTKIQEELSWQSTSCKKKAGSSTGDSETTTVSGFVPFFVYESKDGFDKDYIMLGTCELRIRC
ncbi:MAG: hypothetical protein ACREBS_04875 [Nitrososphaerales archaeon]